MASLLAGVSCFQLTGDEKYLELPRNQINVIMSLGACVSRACLGKIIVFIYKWRKNGVFSPVARHLHLLLLLLLLVPCNRGRQGGGA
jgi:hypothetical protein